MLTKIMALLSSAAFPLLCLKCISDHGPMIQAGVRGFADTAVQAAGLKGINVTADGRDVTLRGFVESEQSKTTAGIAAAAAPAVRSVDNQLVVVTQQAIQTKLNDILLRKKVEFETGKDILLPLSIPVLEEALAVLTQAPNLEISIGGHTDNAGDAAANQALSERRAKAVLEWFASKNIGRDRLSSAGFGQTKPIAANTTEQGRAQNRRVEIIAKGRSN